MEQIAKLDKNERYYHRTDEQLVQFANWKPEFENNMEKIVDNAKLLNIPIEVFESNIFFFFFFLYKKSPCYMFARMRRG